MDDNICIKSLTFCHSMDILLDEETVKIEKMTSFNEISCLRRVS